MKTFTLPDKLANQLIATGKELAHQNNLSTAWPIWYVTEVVKRFDKGGEPYESREYATYGSCFFLTQKACQEYIDANSYHFNKPLPYAGSAHRNHEIQPIIQALILMADEKVPSNHYGKAPADDNQ